MRFWLPIIGRSLRRQLRHSAVTWAGVAFAVAALVVLSSLMVGVNDAMVRNSVAVRTGHVFAEWPEGKAAPAGPMDLKGAGDVRSALWRKSASVMLRSADADCAALVHGVQVEKERRESVLPRKMTAGEFLSKPETIVLGAPLAESLKVKIGETILFRCGEAKCTFRVAGMFRTGIDAVDRTALVDFDELPAPPTELAVFLDSPEPDAAERAAAALRAQFPSATVRTWRAALPELVQILDLNRLAMRVVLVLAGLILCFGVSNTAFLAVAQRTRELGILKAVGLPPVQIVGMVLAELMLPVCVAGAAGLGIGWAAVAVWAKHGLNLTAWTSENVHFLVSGVVYPRATWDVFVWPGVVAAASGLVGGILPSVRAARVEVVRALRWI